MLKSALRQSRLCRLPIAARPLQLASKISTRSLARSTQSRPSIVATCRLPALWSRSYSATADATATPQDSSAEASAEGEGLVTRFEDLSTLGVHENVVSAITKGMGYETMSQVQSMTIQSALAGKDMYGLACFPPF